ncbi:glucosyl-3-phosphoglycerate synthase [Thermoleophilia bacterium SCSIO 60948]|nr:glucosyl-3-phosphoglycerate synthase [Thermoleophilia bacterium SCSIO 60948]
MSGVSHEPGSRLDAIVVVPARDEEDRIASCLEALVGQRGVDPGGFEILLVLDAVSDGTAEVAARFAGGRPTLRTIEGPGRGAGAARALGMDVAYEILHERGDDRSLIATTDADTRVDPDWLAEQLAMVADGARAIAGRIELDPTELAALSRETAIARERELARRTPRHGRGGRSEHPHFAGASIGLTREAYRRAGGMAAVDSLEDEELAKALTTARITIERPDRVRVVTSARTKGRAGRGLALDLAVGEWLSRRREPFREQVRLEPDPDRSVSVILPAREVASTIGPIVDGLVPHRDSGLIDQILVIDSDSRDGTATVAAECGAEVVQEDELLADFGPCRGKGDAMWRAVSVARGGLIAFMDADSRDPDPNFLPRLLAPALADPELVLVKASFRRPLDNGRLQAGEGGRVTELAARPLINLHFPDLRGFEQPLAGEMTIDREVFESLSVPVGYGVEIAMLIDVVRRFGLERVAQVDLGERLNSHQPLGALSTMAFQVAAAVERRVRPGEVATPSRFAPRPVVGFETVSAPTEERPPLDSLAARSGAEGARTASIDG